MFLIDHVCEVVKKQNTHVQRCKRRTSTNKEFNWRKVTVITVTPVVPSLPFRPRPPGTPCEFKQEAHQDFRYMPSDDWVWRFFKYHNAVILNDAMISSQMDLNFMRTLVFLQLLSLNVEDCTRSASVRGLMNINMCRWKTWVSKAVDPCSYYSTFYLISSLQIILASLMNVYLMQTSHRGEHLSTDHSTVGTFPKRLPRIAPNSENQGRACTE